MGMHNISEETAKHRTLEQRLQRSLGGRCPHGTGVHGIAEKTLLTGEGKKESEEYLECERIEDAPPTPFFLGFCIFNFARWVAETIVPTHCNAVLNGRRDGVHS